MIANELRIGNYIKHPNKDVDTVKEILCCHNDEYGIKPNNYHIGYYLEHEGSSVVEPIELNKEWFECFGFKKDAAANYWIDLQTHYLELRETQGYYYPLYVELPELSSEEEQMVSLKRIKYVHELQNLYYILTGTEIKKASEEKNKATAES